MSRSIAVLGFAVAVAACTRPHAYLVLKGGSTTTYSVRSFVVTPAGVSLGLSRTCAQKVIERWCPPAIPECRPDPITTRMEPTPCPAPVDLDVEVRAPWGASYP